MELETRDLNGLLVAVVVGKDGARLAGRVSGLIGNATSGYPGPSPVSIERRDLKRMAGAAHEWWVAEKTDGLRLAMAFFVDAPDGAAPRNMCVWMDRARQVYVCTLKHAPTAFFQGTLLDGELVKTHAGKWAYQVFDALVVSGIPVWRQPFSTRLGIATRGVAVYTPDDDDPVCITVKRFVRATGKEEIAAHIAMASKSVKTDGVVFIREGDAVTFGRCYSMLKLKPPGHHTVDFLLGPKQQLLVYDPAAGRAVPVARLSGKTPPTKAGAIIECRKDVAGRDTWSYVMTRSDKDKSNDMLTFMKTQQNITEGLVLDDVLAALNMQR